MTDLIQEAPPWWLEPTFIKRMVALYRTLIGDTHER